MKAALALMLLVAVLCGEASLWARPPADSGPVTLFGKEYVRLADWAHANDFEIHWLKRDETVLVTNRTARLAFDVDSRGAEVNGIHVWLSHPIVERNGLVYISDLDIRTALRPVLYPARHNSKVQNIVLDPGHGGNDPGNLDGLRQEKKYTLLMAEELSDQLRRAGFKVSLTRTRDAFVSLSERPELARRRGADLFISIHWNSVSAGRKDTRGAQTYCLSPAGVASTNGGNGPTGASSQPGNANNDRNMLLAYSIQKSLVKKLGVEDQGVRRARYQVLREAEMPAVLIEGGYMSHPVESRHIYDAAYRRQMAGAIVEGVIAYRSLVEQAR